ncbi:MAG: DUF3656 domain-containing U32 family peptidase, partial [Turicibacter sp.]
MSKIELLAPVGHKEGLLAAVTNGADAIYVGGAAFGARKEAAFSHEELIEVIKYSHLHHVKVYVTVNTTIFEAELEPLKEYIHFLYTHDADAIIVQDIGVANLVRRLYPDFELHFSTQMTLHNSEGVKFAKDFGADRVVVARENSLDEIKAMKEQVDIDLEVFVHGAICVCYSGQCLMSSMIGARSGNRGMCAQTCRLPYELVDLKTGKTLHSEVGDFLLSPRDLSSIEEVGQLIDAGVTSFKIEGRLKRPEYVATVVKAYREAIDQYMETKRVKLTKQTHEDLNQIFSRGFTKGFLFGETGMNFMSTDRPNHKGILIGEVTAVRGKRVSVNLTSPLHVQDGLRFVSSNIKDKDQGLQVQKMFVKNDDVKIANKGLVEFDVPFTATKGMKVYKTLSVELNKRVEVNEKNTATTPIYGEVTAKLGEPLRMMIWDDHSNVVEVFSECVLETAQKTPLSKDRLSDQLQKTGGTPFKFSYLTVNLEDGITMPISVINAFRREALDKLSAKVMIHNKDRHHDLPQLTTEISPFSIDDQSINELTISVRDLKQLRAVVTHDKVSKIYYKDIKTLGKALELAKPHQKIIIPQLPRIINDEEIKFAVETIASLPIETVMVSEYGMLHALKAANPNLTILADFSFNTNNVQSIEALRQLGITAATLSYEMNQKQMRGLLAQSPLPMEAIVFTR